MEKTTTSNHWFEKVEKASGMASFIIVLLLFLLVFIVGTDDWNRYLNKKSFYNSIVLDKYINKKNHSNRIIILESGKKLCIPPFRENYRIYDLISVGDRMYKEKSTLEGFVIKKDSTILRIDYNFSSQGLVDFF